MNTTQKTNQTTPPQTFIKLHTVQEKTTLSRSAIYAKMKEGTFPKSVKLGVLAIVFIESEIDQWIQDRINESRTPSEVKPATPLIRVTTPSESRAGSF